MKLFFIGLCTGLLIAYALVLVFVISGYWIPKTEALNLQIDSLTARCDSLQWASAKTHEVTGDVDVEIIRYDLPDVAYGQWHKITIVPAPGTISIKNDRIEFTQDSALWLPHWDSTDSTLDKATQDLK